jgi:hypothetical protein
VLTPRTVEELTGMLQPRARDDEEHYRSGAEEGEATRPTRRVSRNRGAEA